MCASAIQAMSCKCLQREELCVKMGIGVYRYANKCVGECLESTVWRHLH